MTPVVYCRIFLHFMSSLINNLKKTNFESVSTIHPQIRSFERRFCAQTKDLQTFKK